MILSYKLVRDDALPFGIGINSTVRYDLLTRKSEMLCFICISVILSCLFFAALGSAAGKGLTSWRFCVLYFLVCVCLLFFLLLSISQLVDRVRYGF